MLWKLRKEKAAAWKNQDKNWVLKAGERQGHLSAGAREWGF